MEVKVRLNKSESLQSGNKNTTLQLNLCNNQKPLIDDDIVTTVNEYSRYLDERESCDKIRLTLQVNVMASNILFNSVSEIVKNEGGTNCECLNFRPHTINCYGKNDYVWGSDMHECIRDTQISKEYDYLAGLDIFDNHIIRAKNSIPIVLSPNSGQEFNTIQDYIIDLEGKKTLSCAYSSSTKTYMHMYNRFDIMKYNESVNTNLQDKNGWLGFHNKSKMTSMDSEGNYIGIERVINNQDANKFIEMYPNHTHFDFLPYYNKLRHRKEKNWEYCLCYPYSSTTKDIPCINDEGRLKILFIDENVMDDDGVLKVMITSVCKHGLKPDDTINLYRNSEDGLSGATIIEKDVIIDSIIDEYSFYIYLPENICTRWVSVLDNVRLNAIFSEIDGLNDKYIRNGKEYHSYNNKINCDFDTDDHIGSQNLSFCRTINKEECKYYVRIFSRMPNFEFMDGELSSEKIYNRQESLGGFPVNYYADSKYEHHSILSRMCYAKSVFGDNIHQIVYTDDICFNYLHDNLGRPLSSLYICFVKTNYGHTEWYNGQVGSDKVEHSHCFGKVNCGLEFAPYADVYGYTQGNTRVMNNIDGNHNGLPIAELRNSETLNIDDDEISFNDMNYFYGDLCEYSLYNANERVLQPILHRFNTQQRELSGSTLSMANKFKTVVKDEIIYDDYDVKESDNFQLEVGNGIIVDAAPTAKREGYVYRPMYEIPIRAWSGQIKTFKPIDLSLYNIQTTTTGYIVTTAKEHKINKDFKVVLFDIRNNEQFLCDINEIVASNKFTCGIKNKSNKEPDLSLGVDNFRLYKVPESVPDYVVLSNGIYRWRYLYENGFEDTEGLIEEYPFTNNSLYINKQINLFVRRQDPFGENGLIDETTSEFEILNGMKVSSDGYGENFAFKERDVLC